MNRPSFVRVIPLGLLTTALMMLPRCGFEGSGVPVNSSDPSVVDRTRPGTDDDPSDEETNCPPNKRYCQNGLLYQCDSEGLGLRYEACAFGCDRERLECKECDAPREAELR